MIPRVIACLFCSTSAEGFTKLRQVSRVQMSGRLKRRQLAILIRLLFCVGAMPAVAATITVTNTNDNGPGSLRQALKNANNGDTISFAVTGTITLTSGALPINKNIAISGPGADQLSIDGNQAVADFGVFFGNTATISGLTARGAQSGILNDGVVAVTDCVLSGNSYNGLSNYGVAAVTSSVLTGNGYDGLYSYQAITSVSNCIVSGNASAGVFNSVPFGPGNSITGSRGSMTISDSTISNNSGPGAWNYVFLTIVNSTLSGNSADDSLGDGGGIRSGTFKAPGGVIVMNSTISGNSASGAGGGISISYGGVTVVNSTISGNSAGKVGGGIANYAGGVQVSNSTVSGNSAGSGGGIYNVAGQFGGTIEISNTIFNAGALGENIFNNGGTVTSQGYNISSDDGAGLLTGPGDQINTDPLLGALQDNGGPTLTHLPLPGSPAIDAGDPNFMPPSFHDQRGPCYYRAFGRRIDVGSVETQPRPRCVTPAPRPGP